MALGDQIDSQILLATYAVLFFGVPSQGMNIESLIPMVGGQPNRTFLESLSRVSETLISQQAGFMKVFPLHKSEVLCFYETLQSPTASKTVSILQSGQMSSFAKRVPFAVLYLSIVLILRA